MLILTRRVGETLMIGDDVTVTVLGVRETKYASVLMLRKMFQFIVKKSICESKLRKTILPVTNKFCWLVFTIFIER